MRIAGWTRTTSGVDPARKEFSVAENETVDEGAQALEDLQQELAEVKKNASKHRREILSEKKKLQEQLERFEGVDPDKFRELSQAHDKAEHERATAEGDFDELRTKLEARHTEVLSEKDDRIGFLETALDKHVVNDRLTAAIVAAGVLPEYQRAAMFEMRDRKPQRVEKDGTFDAVFLDDVGDPVPIEQYVNDWAKSEGAARYMPSEGTSGGGAQESKAGSDGKTVTPGITFVK